MLSPPGPVTSDALGPIPELSGSQTSQPRLNVSQDEGGTPEPELDPFERFYDRDASAASVRSCDTSLVLRIPQVSGPLDDETDGLEPKLSPKQSAPPHLPSPKGPGKSFRDDSSPQPSEAPLFRRSEHWRSWTSGTQRFLITPEPSMPLDEIIDQEAAEAIEALNQACNAAFVIAADRVATARELRAEKGRRRRLAEAAAAKSAAKRKTEQKKRLAQALGRGGGEAVYQTEDGGDQVCVRERKLTWGPRERTLLDK